MTMPAVRERTVYAVKEWSAPEPEKNWMPVSFLLAGALHVFILLGGFYGFIAFPEYGLKGSAASMEIYMVAALPDHAKNQSVISENEESGAEPLAALKSAKGKMAQKSEVRGDGSSAQPGQSVTTLFARGSSETDGKAGKYQNSPPQYPFVAERNGWEGVVLLKALIEREGKPAKVEIEKSSGHRVLDEAALKAVKNWQFTAGHIGGMKVSSWIKIPVRFELQKSA